jgi:hypothetical protein
MLSMHSRGIEDRGSEASTRPAWWPLVIIALAAAAMLLLLGMASFDGLDRLLPEGQPFLPYFTT